MLFRGSTRPSPRPLPAYPTYKVCFFAHGTDPRPMLPLPSGEGRGEGGSELVRASNYPHPNPLPGGEGKKNPLQKALSLRERGQKTYPKKLSLRGRADKKPTPESPLPEGERDKSQPSATP